MVVGKHWIVDRNTHLMVATRDSMNVVEARRWTRRPKSSPSSMFGSFVVIAARHHYALRCSRTVPWDEMRWAHSPCRCESTDQVWSNSHHPLSDFDCQTSAWNFLVACYSFTLQCLTCAELALNALQKLVNAAVALCKHWPSLHCCNWIMAITSHTNIHEVDYLRHLSFCF